MQLVGKNSTIGWLLGICLAGCLAGCVPQPESDASAPEPLAPIACENDWVRTQTTGLLQPAPAPGGAAPRQELQNPRLAIAISHDARLILGSALDGIPVTWHADTDRGAVERVLGNQVVCALITRPVSTLEVQAGTQESVLGWYVLAVVVHPANPVRSLSAAEVRDLMSGRNRSWQPLGGSADPVQVVAPAPGALADLMASIAFPGDRFATSSNSQALVTDRLAAVRSEPGAVTMVDLATLPRDLPALAIATVPPSPRAAEQRRYPFACALRLVWRLATDDLQRFRSGLEAPDTQQRLALRLLRN